VAGNDFVFALELSDEAHFDGMLSDLTSAVLSHVGYSPPAIDELRGALRNALAAGYSGGNSRCDVCFAASSGELLISIAYSGGAEWRTVRPLP
jgi:hypothetical protein